MNFHAFLYAVVGRRQELEQGMAGKDPVLFQRMLKEIGTYARLCDEAGYTGLGLPEHHLQIEGFEAAQEPGLLALYIGMQTKNLRLDQFGYVLPTHNPLRVAEHAATLDHLLGGRLNITGNLFYNAMRDAQRELDFDLNSPGVQVGLLQIVSEPRARTYGAEAEVGARLSERLTVTGSIGLLNTRITRTISPNDPFLNKEFGGAPRFTGVAAIDWKPVGKLHLSAQARHNSGYWGDDSENPVLRIKGWTVVDARASWEARRFTWFAYARNLFDAFHVVAWSGAHDDPNTDVELIDPRELGAGVEVRF